MSELDARSEGMRDEVVSVEEGASDEPSVLSVHFGRSANCSSIGSVVDVLFVSGVVGTAMLASLAVLLGGRAKDGETRVDGEEPPPPAPPRAAGESDGAAR